MAIGAGKLEASVSNKPQGEPGKPNRPKSHVGRIEPPQHDSNSPQGTHSPTPREDAEWEERMDELEGEREELHKNEIVQPGTIDPHDLASIVRRLEVLAATAKQLGQEGTRLSAHLEEALLRLNQATSELAEGHGN